MTTVSGGVRLVTVVSRSPYWLLLAANEIQGWLFRLLLEARSSSSQLESRHFNKAMTFGVKMSWVSMHHVPAGCSLRCLSNYMYYVPSHAGTAFSSNYHM